MGAATIAGTRTHSRLALGAAVLLESAGGAYGQTAGQTCSAEGFCVTSDGVAIFPACVTVVPSGAFAGTQVTSVEIPASVQTIEGDAFQMTPLTTLTFAPGSNLASIDSGAFGSTRLSSLAVPALVQVLEIPPSVTTIDSGGFDHTVILCGGDAALGLLACNHTCNAGEILASTNCAKCPTPGRCTGTGCIQGTRGFFCGYCDFAASPPWAEMLGDCQECPSNIGAAVITTTAVAAASYAVYTISTPNEHADRLACNIAGLITHVQLVSSSINFDVEVPWLFLQLWSWLSSIAFLNVADVAPPACNAQLVFEAIYPSLWDPSLWEGGNHYRSWDEFLLSGNVDQYLDEMYPFTKLLLQGCCVALPLVALTAWIWTQQAR
eukprot:SAG22_NODE_207_length_15278_cov_4.056855_4_plen_379_part_00